MSSSARLSQLLSRSQRCGFPKLSQQQSRHLSAMMIKKHTYEDLNPDVRKALQNLPDVPGKMTREVDPDLRTLFNARDDLELEYTAPVTSAHMISEDKRNISQLDSVAVSPDGKVMHGRYGELPADACAAIPLEYLALLRPAAEGAAALREVTQNGKKKGTILVYGSTRPEGLTVSQMANAAGNAVIGIVDGGHSGNDDIMFCAKNIVDEPGTAVPQEAAASKAFFRELVEGISKGDEGLDPTIDPKTYLQQFKENLVAYTAAYPNTRPAAVREGHMDFDESVNMEKDRQEWAANIGTYLQETLPPGAPPLDEAKFDANFTPEQYELFRQQFWQATTMFVSGVDPPNFLPPQVIQDMIKHPHDPALATQYQGTDPAFFSMYNNEMPPQSDVKPGGPVLGAVICATEELKAAVEAVNKAGPSLRAKAEALQFVTNNVRRTYLAVCGVLSQVPKGAPIVVVGDLPGFKSVKVNPDEDVLAALKAMDVDDHGKTKLNYFIQSYRANDFPFYADYAVFRANEILSGPRTIVVLK